MSGPLPNLSNVPTPRSPQTPSGASLCLLPSCLIRGGLLSLVALLLPALACDAPPVASSMPPEPYVPPPASVLVDASPVAIRREVLKIAVPAPPPNPQASQHAETPPENNFVRLVRYRVDSDPPRPARAIAVLMPGFLGGAGSFDPLARALVRRSTPDAAIEAWAIDRRSNLLEDHHGLDVAEVRGDPELAGGYYFGGTELEGRRFAGMLPQDQAAYMSEWGLTTTISDLHAVLALIPQAARKGHVVLIGHSLGASIAEEYAAWDFAGRPGYEDLAGLVLVDGTTGGEGSATLPLTKQQYQDGIGGGFPRPGLNAIRSRDRYYALPLLGTEVYVTAAISGLRAAWRPMDVTSDSERDSAMRVLLGLSEIPPMTNRAALGFSFDRAYNALSFAAVSCGAGTGGRIEPYRSLLGADLLHPTDVHATYDWVDFDRTQPTGNTALNDLARAWFLGPQLDFAEWYFPTRLALDAPAAGSLVLTTADWPRSEYAMRAIHGRTLELPILALAAGLVGRGGGDQRAYDALRRLVDAVPIGPGRPMAGLPRSMPDAFRVLAYPQLTHIDPLMGADSPISQTQEWYSALHRFLLMHTTDAVSPVVSPLPTP